MVVRKPESLEDIKGIRDKAEVLRQYAAQAGAGLEAQNKCAEIKLRTERKAGEVLKGEKGRPLYRDTPSETLHRDQDDETVRGQWEN